MAEPHEHEFLSLDSSTFAAEDDSGSSPFNTLWTEFARSHPRLSPPRSPSIRVPQRHASVKVEPSKDESRVEMRGLEHVYTYDSNLMCPICHVPFIEPIVLDCDHTFCAACFEEYKTGGSGGERSKCPSCRSYHFGSYRKASRLIKNMCNDVRVRCPNDGCDVVLPRGCIVLHATKECLEERLACPDAKCEKNTKRRNFVPDQCVHLSQVECECGAVIELGRGEWIRHRDEECSHTGARCQKCGERLTGERFLDGSAGHSCRSTSEEPKCPGAEFGCSDEISPDNMVTHSKTCPFARLAPTLKKQALLLQTLQEQLVMTKLRNEALETQFDRISDLLTTHIQPKLDELLINSSTGHDADTDIEEIERHDIPVGGYHSLLPAHVRSITPSPDPGNYQMHQLQHLMQSHTHLETQLNHLTQSLSELDARNSMALMNETLRIREDLAHHNAALYSTRTQVHWLLNRERIAGQREAMAGIAAMRGRQSNGAPHVQNPASPETTIHQASNGSNNIDAGATADTHTDTYNRAFRGNSITSSASGGPSPMLQPSSMPIPIPTSMSSQMPLGSAGSSTNTSPMFSNARPSLRRHSGGSSQERVKL